MNATVNEYQSTRPVEAAAEPASARPLENAAASSCSGLYPPARRTAFRSHCRPNDKSSAPTTSRNVEIGIALSAGPSAATIPASTIVAAPSPYIVERQPRTVPTASTIVSASTASTALARKVARNRRTFELMPGLCRHTSSLGIGAFAERLRETLTSPA